LTFEIFVLVFLAACLHAGWNALDKGASAELDWNEAMTAYTAAYPELAAELNRRLAGELPADFSDQAAAYIARCQEEGLADRIDFRLADVCESGLPDGQADFVWGEDAWCYVVDKSKLIAEAARIVKPGGVIAFTDWVEGSAGLSNEEAAAFLLGMKFKRAFPAIVLGVLIAGIIVTSVAVLLDYSFFRD